MNEHSGAFPNKGSALSLVTGAQTPAMTGLRELVVAGPPRQDRLDVNEIWRVLVKWWWLIAAIAATCVLAAVVVSLMITKEYRATTTIEVNPEGVQVVQTGQLEPMQLPDREFLATQAGLLRSQQLAERVARSLNVAGNTALIPAEGSRDQREKSATALVMNSVTVNPQRDTRLLEIQVESPDPNLAAAIANSYAENFSSWNVEKKYRASDFARTYLQDRIAERKKKLEESERAAFAYAQQNGILELSTPSKDNPNAGQSLDASSLVTLNQQLAMARDERIAAEQKYRRAQQSMSDTQTLSNTTIQELTSRREQLQAEYEEKLNTFQADYPQMKALRDKIESLSRGIAAQTRSVSGSVSGTLYAEYAAAVARENALQNQVNQLKGRVMDLRGRSIQYTILQREVAQDQQLYEELLKRYREVGVAGGIGESTVSIIDRAQVPGAPFKPNLPMNIAIGLIAGLILGCGTAFAIEWIDDTIKTPDDLTSKLGIASLGVIPVIGKGEVVKEHLADPRSQLSEAYQSVRTALQFSTDHGVPRTLLVTSTRAAEGKSSTALALAQTLASLGARVLLIDADLRKPTFRGPSSSSQGLSSLLAGGDDVRACIHPTHAERLFLLPSGPIPPNPAELFASGRIQDVLTDVLRDFDQVIIDGPPVLGLADAPLLASMCEGTMMVIEANSIRRAAALNSVNRLRTADARLMGGILTKFNAAKVGYGYGYGYGYGDELYSYREGDEPKKQIELLKSE